MWRHLRCWRRTSASRQDLEDNDEESSDSPESYPGCTNTTVLVVICKAVSLPRLWVFEMAACIAIFSFCELAVKVSASIMCAEKDRPDQRRWSIKNKNGYWHMSSSRFLVYWHAGNQSRRSLQEVDQNCTGKANEHSRGTKTENGGKHHLYLVLGILWPAVCGQSLIVMMFEGVWRGWGWKDGMKI